eukprot:scaffold660_cov365-Pavlova_lutheri.AAC.8
MGFRPHLCSSRVGVFARAPGPHAGLVHVFCERVPRVLRSQELGYGVGRSEPTSHRRSGGPGASQDVLRVPHASERRSSLVQKRLRARFRLIHSWRPGLGARRTSSMALCSSLDLPPRRKVEDLPMDGQPEGSSLHRMPTKDKGITYWMLEWKQALGGSSYRTNVCGDDLGTG